MSDALVLWDIAAARVGAALPAIGSGLLVILGFWIAAAVARAVLRRAVARAGPDRAPLVGLAGEGAWWLILGFGLVSGLGTMGVDVAALVAGLGLTGFALGFALRDAVANLLAGVLVMIYRPFRRGDRIIVAGYEGTVVDTNLRYTVLQGEARRFLVPNQTLFNSPLTVLARPAA